MFIYTNGSDDYGKRDMTLRKLLFYLADDLSECENKDEMMGMLSMIYNGDLDTEYVPNCDDMIENGIEYTGLDPIYYSPRIERLFNRQVIIIGEIYSQRFSGVDYDITIDMSVTFTRRYLINSKRVILNLPFPITSDEQNMVLSF